MDFEEVIQFLDQAKAECRPDLKDAESLRSQMKELDSRIEALQVSRAEVVDIEDADQALEQKIEELKSEHRKLECKYEELQSETDEVVNTWNNAVDAVKEMKRVWDRAHHNLAVQKGVCSFPNCCDAADYCTKDHCHFDTCANGHAYRMS